MILIQISIAARNKATFNGEPDLSVESAKLYFVLFMPGVSAGLVCFAVFGTTKTYGGYLCRVLIPGWVRRMVAKMTSKSPGMELGNGGAMPGQEDHCAKAEPKS